jgi:hypothetical protein
MVAHRNDLMASPSELHAPPWLRRGDPESTVPVLIAVLAVMALQIAIPRSYTLVPRRAGERPYPDFLFPQMSTPDVAAPDGGPPSSTT